MQGSANKHARTINTHTNSGLWSAPAGGVALVGTRGRQGTLSEGSFKSGLINNDKGCSRRHSSYTT